MSCLKIHIVKSHSPKTMLAYQRAVKNMKAFSMSKSELIEEVELEEEKAIRMKKKRKK